MYPKMVKMTLRNNAPEHPSSRKTPNGGKITAKINLMISEQVTAMIDYYGSR